MMVVLLTGLAEPSAYAQTINESVKNITTKLNSYTAAYSTEKVYLQFDKPYYAAGDTIYFKAYVTLSTQHKLSALSGVVNIDLINPANKISRSIKLPVIAGVAWGDFALADTLKGGSYRIRAYTNWMRNEGENSFFEHIIPVGTTTTQSIPENGERSNKTIVKTTSKKPDVQFLPEGGSLVIGNYSKIAFKAVNPDGQGTDIKGTVTDDIGTEVCTFASTHLGMGAFNLVPQAGKIYKANITYADGTTNTTELPKAANTGYTINLNNTNPDTIRLRISAGSESTLDKLTLVAQSGGIIYYAAESTSGNKFFTAVIPKNKFPTGIAQFTLFNEKGEPLNERLVFINNNDELKLTVQSRGSYATRQKVKLELYAKDKNAKPVTGSFSIAVVDETKVPIDEQNENTILSDLLLTSDLRGNIESPNYYFTNITDKTNADLDLLMLTQGYRRFEWKQILNNTDQAMLYQPEKSLTISGKITKNGKPVPNGKITLFTTSGGAFLLDTLSDANGRFVFRDLQFGDSTKFVVQSKVTKGQDNIVLELDTIMPPTVTAGNLGIGKTAVSSTDMATYLQNQEQLFREQLKYGINKNSLVLKEVIIKGQKEKIIPHSQNLNGAGNADIVFTEKDIDKMIGGNLEAALRGATHLRFRNGAPEGMAIVVDGTFVDADVFDTLHPDDIEGIEIITGPHYGAIYGSRMAGGGIIITTRKARKANNYYRYAPGVVTYMPKGYYKAREFYSPQYDNPKTNQKMADLRSTIYWQPNIITDKDGKASIEYFNADGKGTYRVVIEGIDTDGNLGRQVYRYKVE